MWHSYLVWAALLYEGLTHVDDINILLFPLQLIEVSTLELKICFLFLFIYMVMMWYINNIDNGTNRCLCLKLTQLSWTYCPNSTKQLLPSIWHMKLNILFKLYSGWLGVYYNNSCSKKKIIIAPYYQYLTFKI